MIQVVSLSKDSGPEESKVSGPKTDFIISAPTSLMILTTSTRARLGRNDISKSRP